MKKEEKIDIATAREFIFMFKKSVKLLVRNLRVVYEKIRQLDIM